MNELIKEQLSKCKVAKIPVYDDDTCQIFIEKYNPKSHGVLENHYYLVKLADYILNPPAGYHLHINWNKGIKPVSDHMKCEVITTMGEMVKIHGVGYDMDSQVDKDDIWEGWLPREAITVIKEI